MKNVSIEEAKKITNNAISQVTRSDKKEAMSYIIEAANKGSYSVSIDINHFDCYKAVKLWLQNLGYKVWIVYKTLWISWEENNE